MQIFQTLTNEYIHKSNQLSISERLEFLEEYRLLLPESFFIEYKQKCLEKWSQTRNHSGSDPE
ncbi:hypothetical protein EHS11_12545 [Leptospira ilyithenensis]|uniref:Uncharacterized protein n=1 Tax=Leptospira ilyithenensis TaxID=2484901 RepID=A0A4V3JWX1_9LEPT|nr:hypothetical protein EHS11_12545 [Leptospira ilyithenensis]